MVSLWVDLVPLKLCDFPAGGREPNWRTGMAWRRIKRKDRMVSCELCGENPRKRGSCSRQTRDWPDHHPCTQTGCAGATCSSGSDLGGALHCPQQLGRLQLHVRVAMLFLVTSQSPPSDLFSLSISLVLGYTSAYVLWTALKSVVARRWFSLIQSKAWSLVSFSHQSVSFILLEEMEKYSFLAICLTSISVSKYSVISWI